MGITKENIRQLINLQGHDLVLDKLRSGIDLIPKEIAVLRQGLDGAKAKLAGAKAAILTWEKKKKEKELEFAAKDEAIRKHSMELNQVKTNDAFKALQHEIEQARVAGGAIETEILECMEGIDAGRAEEKVAAAELKASEADAQVHIGALEKELAELQGKFSEQKSVREAAAAQVPAEMLRLYDHARGRGKADVIVPADGGSCSACRINLAPQMIVELAKAKSLVVCESCQRILYKPEPAVKPEPADKPA